MHHSNSSDTSGCCIFIDIATDVVTLRVVAGDIR
jgi:hypothetical protein